MLGFAAGSNVSPELLFWQKLLYYCWKDPSDRFLEQYFEAGAGGIFSAEGDYRARERFGLRGYAAFSVACAPEKAHIAVAGAHRLLQSYAPSAERLASAAGKVKTDVLLNFHYREPWEDAYFAERWRLAGYREQPADFHGFVPAEADTAYFNARYAAHVKNRPRAYAVIGDASKMDMKALARFGRIVELKPEDILTTQ